MRAQVLSAGKADGREAIGKERKSSCVRGTRVGAFPSQDQRRQRPQMLYATPRCHGRQYQEKIRKIATGVHAPTRTRRAAAFRG